MPVSRRCAKEIRKRKSPVAAGSDSVEAVVLFQVIVVLCSVNSKGFKFINSLVC